MNWKDLIVMKINYVTGNKGKVKLAQMILANYPIEIIQRDIDIPEIQSLDCHEVAFHSAKDAADRLGEPVLKNDSGLVIEALDGFPGALAKYVENNLRAEGFLKLMKDVENRTCYWIEVLAYCKPGCDPVLFTSKTYGTISLDARPLRGYPYDEFFIPKGDTRTFSEMTEEEQLSCFDTKAYHELAKYLEGLEE